MPRIRLSWKHFDTFSKKIPQGNYPPSTKNSLFLFHCYTKLRMEIALHAFKCLKKYLPPKEMQEPPFRCSLHSFLTHVKSAIDSLTEEINLSYGIDPKLAAKGKTMSIEKLLDKRLKNRQKLVHANPQLLTEIRNVTMAQWFKDLKNLRDEEAVHGAISGKTWRAYLGVHPPKISLGVKDVSDFAIWCPEILKEANKFLEKCYQQM